MHTTIVDRIIATFIALVVIFRICIGSNLLNQYVGYTSGEGSLLGRFHPGTYLLIIPCLLYMIRGRYTFVPLIDIAILAVLTAAGIALANGGASAASVIVDTELAGLLIARLLITSSEDSRSRIFSIIIGLLFINLVIIIGERFTEVALIPRRGVEQFFRPQGLLDHPLTAGWACCLAMWAVLKSNLRRRTAILINVFLLIEVLLCAVRLPLVIAGGLLTLTLISAGGKGVVGKIGAAGLALALVPALVAVSAALGLLDRFINLGFFDDESAASRLQSWILIERLGKDGFLYGVDQQTIAALSSIHDVSIIENSFVMFVLLGGVFVAILVHIGIALGTMLAWSRSVSYLAILTGIAVGTISFSTKSAVVIIAFIFAAMFRPGRFAPDGPDPSRSSNQ